MLEQVNIVGVITPWAAWHGAYNYRPGSVLLALDRPVYRNTQNVRTQL